jgi:hypothetical protein
LRFQTKSVKLKRPVTQTAMSKMHAQESRNRPVLGVLVFAIAVLFGAYFLVELRENNGPALTNSTQRQSAATTEMTGPLNQPTTRGNVDFTTSDAAPSENEITQQILLCRRADNGKPLAGVSLYQEGVLGAGPTLANGKLAFGDLGWKAWILWAPGWIPQRLSGSNMPTEALLVAADGQVEITLLQSTPQHTIIRSLLQKHGSETPPEGPWTPRLQTANWDRLIAKKVPSGTYDIYLWISKDMGTPEPYTLHAVELKPEQHLRLSIDLVADQQDTHEDDS